MDDLNDMLPRLNALDHLLTYRFGFHPFDKIPGHLEIDIGLEQRQAHFAQRVPDITLRNFAQSPKIPERVLELAA
jgi:hypothetical protein